MKVSAWIRKISTLLQSVYEELVEFIKFLSGIIVLVACLLWSIVVLLFFPFWILFQRWRKKRFVKYLTSISRCIPWSEFIYQTEHANGTVIIEVGNKMQTRYWWTEDRIRDMAPIAVPPFNTIDIICPGEKKQYPFSKWCYENYTSRQTGKAILAYPIAADFETFPSGEDYEERMKKLFPRQQVIVLTFYDTKYA